MSVIDVLTAAPVIPVIVVDSAEEAVPLARALVAGGITSLEVTLRTPAGLDAISAIATEVPEAIIGAGTVTTPRDVDAAVAAGATFLVSPGSTESLLDAMMASGADVLPGVATPSELMVLLERGLTHAKLFPASVVGGIPMLKALAGPFPQVTFCPTGGISIANARDFLALPNVACVGGSWLTPPDALRAKDWGRIEALAREAASLKA